MPVPVFVQSALARSVGAGSVASFYAPAFSSNTTIGNLIVVAVANFVSPATTVSTVTDSQSNTYTRANGSSGSNNLEIWYAANINGGANTVTATLTNSVGGAVMVYEFSYIRNTPFDQTNTNGATGTAADGGSLTTTNNKALIFAACGTGIAGGGLTANANYTGSDTSFGNGVSNGHLGTEYRALPAKITDTPGFTVGSSTAWGAASVDFLGTPDQSFRPIVMRPGQFKPGIAR